MNLYHVTKFSPYFPFPLYCFYTKISSFMPVLTIGIVRDCFYLLIFYSEKFSISVWRLPFAVNVNLNRLRESRTVLEDKLPRSPPPKQHASERISGLTGLWVYLFYPNFFPSKTTTFPAQNMRAHREVINDLVVSLRSWRYCGMRD